MHLIIDYSHGNFAIYEATMENALKILSFYASQFEQSPAYKALKSNKVVHTKEKIQTILNGMLTKPEGTVLTKSISVSAQGHQEVISFSQKHKLPFDWEQGISGTYNLFKNFDFKDFKFFSENPLYQAEDYVLVYEDELRQAKAYICATENKFKESASDIAKIRFILELAQEQCHRDVRYSVEELKKLS